MDIVGDRKFVEVPGSKTHELPPLLVRTSPGVRRLDKVMDVAGDIIDGEDMLPPQGLDDPLIATELDRRRMDLAVNLVDQYLGLMKHWNWGDSVLEWIRQCEMTFENRLELRNLMRADLWPHAGRSSFVRLLEDKAIKSSEELQQSVGLRLAFRRPPPMRSLSNQFLFYLNHNVASTAYETWARMSPDPISALPPERFTFQVVDMSLE